MYLIQKKKKVNIAKLIIILSQNIWDKRF